MANTALRIRRSLTTGMPGSLVAGEIAYSYQSNTMFIGSPAGTGVLNIGGQYYTSTIDSATSSNTGGTLVQRSATGNIFVGHANVRSISFSDGGVLSTTSFSGNANSATQFQTNRFIDITGGDITASAQLYDGTANATLSAALNTVAGLSAGTYGGSTVIPIIQVAANGRVMVIANSATISTSLSVAADSGTTDVVNLATDTFTIAGGAGLTSTVTNNQVTIDVDTTVIRANTPSMRQTIDGDLIISGNVSILGNSTVYNVETLSVEDSLIALGKNNTSDAVDIGFYGHYNNGADRHAGLMRNAGDGFFYLFDNYNIEPTGNVINVADASFRQANLKSNLIAAYANTTQANVGNLFVAGTAQIKSLTLTDDLTVPNGGTGASTFTIGSILVGDGTDSLKELSNTTFTATGSGAQNNTITSVTVDSYGRTTAATFQAINGLTVGQGGTGKSTFASGKVVIGNGTGALVELANVTYTLTGSLSAAKTITSLTVDDYGRVSAATAADISGLTVTQGGTGASTLSAGGLLIGNGTGAISTLANTTYTLTGSLGAAKTITSLTVDAYGRVSAATAADIAGLTVAQGGTGASTFTSKGIVYGDGTNALAVTSAAGTSDQTWSNQILTTTDAGVPVWSSSIDGGQF
jgi:fibronectin-binding autotransporter adhesin